MPWLSLLKVALSLASARSEGALARSRGVPLEPGPGKLGWESRMAWKAGWEAENARIARDGMSAEEKARRWQLAEEMKQRIAKLP